MKRSNGFSLLELMIVIAVIGILIAIAIPSYQIYTRRAHYTELVEAAVPYRIGVEECFEITGALDECSAGKNGVPQDLQVEMSSHSLIQSIKVTVGGQVTIIPQNKYGVMPQDTYILTPKPYQERLTWVSSGGGVAKGYAN